MRVTPAGIALILAAESCSLVAYLDVAGIPTIGWGTTRYPPWCLEGRRVKMGDACTQADADLFFKHDLEAFETAIDSMTVDTITPHQADALVSFGYNVGPENYRGSHLRIRVNADPCDPLIRAEFMKWHFSGGRPVKGLWNRRHREADFYFGVTTPRPPWPYGKAT